MTCPWSKFGKLQCVCLWVSFWASIMRLIRLDTFDVYFEKGCKIQSKKEKKDKNKIYYCWHRSVSRTSPSVMQVSHQVFYLTSERGQEIWWWWPCMHIWSCVHVEPFPKKQLKGNWDISDGHNLVPEIIVSILYGATFNGKCTLRRSGFFSLWVTIYNWQNHILHTCHKLWCAQKLVRSFLWEVWQIFISDFS